MANNFFPLGYQPAYYQPQYQPQQYQQNSQMIQQQMQPQNQIHQQQAIQQGGFIRVQSEADARAYPVAPGTSVTFIDDAAPYCYVKTMDFSQFGKPKFEKYKLVKEDDTPTAPQSAQDDASGAGGQRVEYALKSDLEALQGELDALKEKMESQGVKKTVTRIKKGDDDDE